MLWLFVFFLHTPSADAQDALVVITKGSVLAGPTKALTAVKAGSHLHDGDTIQVGHQAFAILALSDKSQLKLNADSEIGLHLPTPQNPRSWVTLTAGAVFAQIRHQDEQHFEVRTPAAVAGVRGTEFFVAYTPDKDDESTWMCVHEGSVEITPTDKSPKSVVVPAGFGVSVKKGKPIDAPQRFAWTQHLNWNLDPKAGELEDKTQISNLYRKELLKKNYD